MLRKGARWTKVDAYYMEASFCQSQPIPADPRGCLLMNHDIPVSTRIYNTTQELIELLTQPELRFAFAV